MSHDSSPAAAPTARAFRPAVLSSVCLAIYYVLSMSRDLSLYDSGELALAAQQLGLGHPPGQPLHTLLGHVCAWLSPAGALFGINLLSALPSALCVLPATRIAEALSGPQAARMARRWLPCLFIPLGMHESVWEPSTRVEVYALATFCALCAVASALPLMAAVPAGRRVQARAAWGTGILLGLSASANPGVALATGAALAPGVLLTRSLPLILRVGCGGILGLLPYLYLPLVAARADAFVWGGLQDGPSVLRYLSMRDYGQNRGLGALGVLEHALAWGVWALRHLLGPWLIFGLGGFWRGRHGLRFGYLVPLIAFALVLMLVSSNVVWDLEIPDYNGYLAIAYWLAAAGSAALFARSYAHGRGMACAVLALCLIASVASAPAPWMRTRHEDFLARHLAEQVLHEAPPGAIVISNADYYAGSLLYLQEAEHQRPDVTVLAYGLSGSSWHWRHIMRRHPDLAPVDLEHRGPRRLRVRDWLARNSAHPVLVEELGIARELDLPVCPGGLYLVVADRCDAAPRPISAQLLAADLHVLDGGSPSAAEAIAQVSEHLGSALWQLGAVAMAHEVLLAGVPRAHWPARIADMHELAEGIAGSPPPRWKRPAALGDPARNLFLAGALVSRAGQSHLARGYAQAAANMGLPEALQLLAAHASGAPRRGQLHDHDPEQDQERRTGEAGAPGLVQ